mgnify:CR=1 FL=1
MKWRFVAAISIFLTLKINKMRKIKALGIQKIKSLGLNVKKLGDSSRFFLEKKGKYHSASRNFPNVDFDKISYQEYSEVINLKYQ